MKSMMTAKLLAAASLTALTLGAGTARAETWRYAFEEAMDHVCGHAGVWKPTGREIARHNLDKHSGPALETMAPGAADGGA